MLTVIFTPWSRPACQPGLSRHRLESFHGRVTPRSRVTGDLASAPLSSSSLYHIHGWTLSRVCQLPAPDLPAGPATATMLKVLDFSPRLLQKLWNCSYRLGSCPFPAQLPTAACLPSTLQPHTHPSPLTAARGTQILVLAGCLHSCWSLGPVYIHQNCLGGPPWQPSV